VKIVVIGGSGLIGSRLVDKLREAGHAALAASPDSGVNTLTGEGLDDALEGARVVIDVSNAPNWSEEAVLEFFQTSPRNILVAEATLGARYFGATLYERSLIPGDDARIAPTRFQDWLCQSMVGKRMATNAQTGGRR
jgi:uncharacterized protein YbjT (DUF2867 family)